MESRKISQRRMFGNLVVDKSGVAIHQGQDGHHSFDAVNWTRDEFLWHLHCDARLTPLPRHCSASTLSAPSALHSNLL